MGKIVIASTHLDSHQTRLALSALEGMAEQINSNKKVRWGLDHDLSLPPLGIIDEAEIIKGDDGEFYLLVSQVSYEECSMLEMPNGKTLIKESFSYPISFIDNLEIGIQNIIIGFDPINVGSEKDLDHLYNDIYSESGVYFEEGSFLRKSLIPDPSVAIQLVEHMFEALVAYKLVAKTIDTIQEKLADDFYSLIRATAKKASEKLIPFNKPITYIFKGIYKDITFELLVRTRSNDILMMSIEPRHLQELAKEISSYKNAFQAIKIQFMYNTDKESWDVNYLIDVNGAVIGSIKCFERQKLVINDMLLGRENNTFLD